MEFCKVTGCNRTVEKEGLCSKHYAAQCLGVDLDIPNEKSGIGGKIVGEATPVAVKKFVPVHEYDKKSAGLKVEDRFALLKEQGKKCACCGRPIPRLIQAKVDFNPETGMVRELICRGCEYIMRGSEASIEKLEQALAYAKRHSSEEEV